MKIGNFDIYEVQENTMPNVATSSFPDATPQEVEDARKVLPPDLFLKDGRGVLVFRSYVLRTAHHTIVVDTCWGNNKNRQATMPFAHMLNTPYLHNLKQAGVSPDVVDYVFCTHMHVDHIGWNTRLENGTWVPTFPNARYLFGRTEWDHWNTRAESDWGSDAIQDSVTPIVEAGLSDIVENDHALDIENGAWIEPLPGHTPGHQGLHIKSSGQEAVFIGDMMHSPLQVVRPEWNMAVCIDQEQSRKTRRKFLETYADTTVRVLPAHFQVADGGHVVSRADGFGFKI